MADNSLQGGTDLIRGIDKTGVKTQVFALDIGGAGAESLMTPANPLPVGGDILSALQTLLTTLTGSIAAHNSPFVDGSPGMVVLGKRRDSDSTLVGDGDLNTLNTDEEGRLKVSTKPASYATVSGNVAAVNETVFIDCQRFSGVALQVHGTFAAMNCTFEVSNNSTNGVDGNWGVIQAARSNANTAETTTGSLSASPAYLWEVSVNPYKWFRVKCTARTSGTMTWTLVPGSYATEVTPVVQVTSAQPVTFTQAALPAGTARMGFVAGAGIWYDDSSTVLAAAASFTGTSRDLTVTATATAMANAATYAKELRASAESDQTGTLWLETSRDATNWRRVKSVATVAVAGGGFFAEIIHRPSWRYARVGFTNGATLQTRFTIGSLAVAS